MRSSAVLFLLDELGGGGSTTTRVRRPWGVMREVTFGDLLIKLIQVYEGHRTSLQYHREKDEVIIPLEGDGVVQVGDRTYHARRILGTVEHDVVRNGAIRIRPGVRHRVTGPLLYIEVETNDLGADTIRVEDDYGRREPDDDQESLLPGRGLD